MQNTDFYHSLLHLTSDWTVARVETHHDVRVIDVYLEYTRSDAPSPDGSQRCAIYDRREERRWRHLDTMQYKTYLHARVPRIRLASGEVVTIAVPWSEPHSHHSVLFEAFAIELLLATKNQTQSARLLRISFDQLHRIMTRAVARGEARRQQTLATETPATRISIDEKCYQRGYRYLTIVSNAETGQVLGVTEGHALIDATEALAEAIPTAHRARIQAVAMDMADTYRRAAEAIFPQAQIVHDKFHLFQYLTRVIDSVRREEVRTQSLLRRTRPLWLKNSERQSAADKRLFQAVNTVTLQTAQAWRVRENFKEMYARCATVDEAIHYFYQWKDHALRTMIRPLQPIVRQFEARIHGIVNYFRYPISNARAEQLNSKISLLNRIAKGFRRARNIRTAILFFFGNLDLLPQSSL
ncbi:MAG: ISL3 family transposase [Acidobacteriaceae bacterium]